MSTIEQRIAAERAEFIDRADKAQVCRCGHPQPDAEMDGDPMCSKCGRRCGRGTSPRELSKAEAALIEAVADRVLDRLAAAGATNGRAPDVGTRWLCTKEVASATGMTPKFIRRHAHELGARRFGDGPRPRLLFPPSAVTLAVDATGPK